MSEAEVATPPKLRVFSAPGRGGLGCDPKKTCLLCIEFQNEFTTEGGKLHGKVRENMEANGMLQKTSQLAKQLRTLGVKVFHAPITFAPDSGDNPNMHLGILAACDYNKLFVRGTWNAKICDAMTPTKEDIVVKGKRGLSAFVDTDLQMHLKKHKIETIALAGFMANCCVESTMRDACERGYNVVTLIDCVATTSMRGYAAATEITYPFFSIPLNASSFLSNIKSAIAEDKRKILPQKKDSPAPAPSASASAAPAKKRAKLSPSKCQPVMHPIRAWECRAMSGDSVYQMGPWFVDVRQSTVGEVLHVRSGRHELKRYLTFAEAAGVHGRWGCGCLKDTIYAAKMPPLGESVESFGWYCNMTVIRLPGGGCLLYSPILDEQDSLAGVLKALERHNLLPIRAILAPSPQHHIALGYYQERFPDLVFLCGRGSPQMKPLSNKRRDLRFDGLLGMVHPSGISAAAGGGDGEGAGGGDGKVVCVPPRIGGATPKQLAAAVAVWKVIQSVCDAAVMADNRTGEVVLRHRPTNTLIVSDLLYKSSPSVVGPGGVNHRYTAPDWFAKGQQQLFYALPTDNSNGLLPSYRTHPRMRSLDVPGLRASFDRMLGWGFDKVVTCHTDPIEGKEGRRLFKQAWGWLWEEE